MPHSGAPRTVACEPGRWHQTVYVPTPTNVIFFESAGELRAWFEANHDNAAELWVGYHRKHTGRPTVTWPEVVDQALCFGWIDSVRYSLDGDSAAQRLTPRRRRSTWSAVNVRKFEALQRAGLVHPKGRAAFEARSAGRTGVYAYENRARELGPDLEARFRAQSAAWDYFQSQAAWYRATASFWVLSARRDETRERRFAALVEHSRKGERIPPLARPARATGR